MKLADTVRAKIKTSDSKPFTLFDFLSYLSSHRQLLIFKIIFFRIKNLLFCLINLLHRLVELVIFIEVIILLFNSNLVDLLAVLLVLDVFFLILIEVVPWCHFVNVCKEVLIITILPRFQILTFPFCYLHIFYSQKVQEEAAQLISYVCSSYSYV